MEMAEMSWLKIVLTVVGSVGVLSVFALIGILGGMGNNAPDEFGHDPVDDDNG